MIKKTAEKTILNNRVLRLITYSSFPFILFSTRANPLIYLSLLQLSSQNIQKKLPNNRYFKICLNFPRKKSNKLKEI